MIRVFCIGNDGVARYMFEMDKLTKKRYAELRRISRAVKRRLIIDRNRTETLIYPTGRVVKDLRSKRGG